MQVTYDPNQAAEHAQHVAAASSLRNLFGILTSNAPPSKPGVSSNGVTSLGPNNNVFVVYNAGINLGMNQSYIYLGLASQAPLRLKELRFRSHTNAPGASPTNPIPVVVEADIFENFPNVSVLGTIPIFCGELAEKRLSPNLRIRSKITYIRFRATIPIPDGNNYIAYTDIRLDVSLNSDG